MNEKKFRKAMKRAYKNMVPRHYCPVDTTASIQDHEVVITDPNDSELWYRVGMFDPMDDTDEELQEWFDEMRIVINSDYDCTGRAFTRYISWHRNPNGMVSYVHALGLDV